MKRETLQTATHHELTILFTETCCSLQCSLRVSHFLRQTETTARAAHPTPVFIKRPGIRTPKPIRTHYSSAHTIPKTENLGCAPLYPRISYKFKFKDFLYTVQLKIHYGAEERREEKMKKEKEEREEKKKRKEEEKKE